MIVIGSSRIDKSIFVFNFDTIVVSLRSSEDNISLEYHPILLYHDMPSIDLTRVTFALTFSSLTLFLFAFLIFAYFF
jgi:hypothetical protein